LFTLCKGTANSPFLWGAISRVPRGRYLPSSDVAIGEMQYFCIENYIQLSRYSGEANKECETVVGLKQTIVEFLFSSVLSRNNRSLRGHC
jgi:hypothetical protein